MSDDTPSPSSWSMRGLKRWLSTAPETRDELIRLVQDSRQFLEPDTVLFLLIQIQRGTVSFTK